MHGNVAEWCLDRYESNFYFQPEASGLNPVNNSASIYRVIRGGGFGYPANRMRSAARWHLDIRNWDPSIGFRPAFTLPIIDEEDAEAEE